MKRILIISFLAIATLGQAQNKPMSLVPRNQLRFSEKAGVQEFTGRMLVRPLQAEAFRRMGVSQLTAQFNHVLAESRIGDVTVSHIKEIDVYVTKIPSGMDENSFAKQLMSSGLYEYVEPDYRVFPAYVPNDPQYVNQWSHLDNDSPNAWDICRGNSAVTIGVTDTGVHVTHEDLVTPRLPGANSATATSTADVKTEGVDGVQWVMDLSGHGTHTSGIACATGGNGVGVCGVNIEGTKEFMVRVSDNSGGGTSLSGITIAALWAAEHGARIVSTSYSGVQNSAIGTTGTVLKSNFDSLWIYAAGNDGQNYGSSYDWPDVMVVGSIDRGDTRSNFSAYGLFTDVFAPGGNIVSTTWTPGNQTNTYGFMSGTSMAAPYAAGVAAMVLSENPSYSAQRVEDIVERTSINIQNDSTTFGWGRVNLWNAMGRVPNSATVTMGNLASGTLTDLYRVDGSSYVLAKGFVPSPLSPKVQFVTEHNVPAYANNNYGEIDVLSTVNVNTTNTTFTQRIQLFNFTTSQYETIGTGGVTGAVVEADKTVDANTFANYIQNGKVRVRMQIFQSGSVPINNWQASFDQVVVRTLRATQ